MTPTRKAALVADAAVIVLLAAMIGCNNPMTLTPSPLDPKDKPSFDRPLPKLAKPRIVVHKSARVLTVYDGRRVVKKYRCCSGINSGDKDREGDRKTPLGDFFVCYKNPKSNYTLSLGLNYPNEEDAARGLQSGLITQAQHDELVAATRGRTLDAATWERLWKTPLGGEIMIHGAGADRRGTAGCVGMDDDDIRELYPAIPLGTPVTIKP